MLTAAARIRWFLLAGRAVLFAAVPSILSAVILLNVTGFCYSQIRYVSDDEILARALDLDWKINMERVVARNPYTRTTKLAEFIQKVPTSGRVSGRTLHLRSLFDKDPVIDIPRDIFRLIGIYEVLASLAFDSGVGNQRYVTWFRGFDRCGEPTYVTFSDDDDKLSDDELNGQWRNAHVLGGKIGFSKENRAESGGALK